MKRALAFVAVVLTAVTTNHARQQPASLMSGLVVELVEPGSAPDVAGLKAGDELIQWSRSVSAVAPAATGEFRTPFDAREFELEQLPRGGSVVIAMRDGARVEARLIPGYWGVSVRPAFDTRDLATYEAGRNQLAKQPADALTTWQPLIETMSAAGGDRGGAAWLLTRVAASFIAVDEPDRGDALFEQAAALVRGVQNQPLEAMVWESKGQAYRPEDFVPHAIDSSGTRPPRLVASLGAFEQARAVWIAAPGEHALARAESDMKIVGIATSAPQYFLALGSPNGPTTVARYDQIRKDVLAAFTQLAPDSFARARLLRKLSPFVSIAYGPSPGIGKFATLAEAEATRLPYLRQALSILEAVAPTHAETRAVLQSLTSYLTYLVPVPSEATRREYEAVQRKRMQLADQVGERALRESAAMSLATSEVARGAITDALAVRDELLRTGSTYTSLASGLLTLAGRINAAGARPLAIEVLEALVKGTSPPYLPAVNTLAQYYRQAGDLTSEARVLTSVVGRMDDGSLAIAEQVNFGDMLARAALNRPDLEAADSWARRALAAAQSTAATSGAAQLALRYDLLLDIAGRQGDLEAYRQYLNLAIAQYRQIANLTQTQRDTLRNHMLTASTTGAEREAIWAQELADARKASPGSLRERTALWNLGSQQYARGDYAATEKTLLEALAIDRRLQPGSVVLQDTLIALGQVSENGGDQTKALGYFVDAFALQEDRRLRSAGARESWAVPSGLTTATAAPAATAVDTNASVLLVDLLVRMGNLSRAFEIAERSRAGRLLQMLGTRSARDTASVPADLDERRRGLEREYEECQRKLGTLSIVKDSAAVVQAQSDLARLRQQLSDIDREIAAHYPVAAALERPAVVSLADARASLDHGTVLLSYLTGSFKTFLFVVTPAVDTAPGESGVVVYELPVSGPELQKSISAFGRLIEWDDREPMLSRARALYDTLVRPAERQIGRAQRILLSLDGSLQSLSFASLVRNQTGKPRFLVEWKALYITPSMSVYAETLKQRRAIDPAGALVAFGDPEYVRPTPGAASVDADVEGVLRAGGSMTRLPGTRREVEAIAVLFSPKATTFLGTSATAAQAMAIGKSARFIHFAVHGVLNETLPMNSALVFSTPLPNAPAGDDGLLQAWQIFGHMQIDADLVTLSACESGLGKDLPGEGLVGLTRAFLYAGARTVAASLWKVADGPTAVLMTHFYANLRAGESKDEALRHAQITLIQMGRPPGSHVDFSSPAYWAAFTLTGDWK